MNTELNSTTKTKKGMPPLKSTSVGTHPTSAGIFPTPKDKLPTLVGTHPTSVGTFPTLTAPLPTPSTKKASPRWEMLSIK